MNSSDQVKHQRLEAGVVRRVHVAQKAFGEVSVAQEDASDVVHVEIVLPRSTVVKESVEATLNRHAEIGRGIDQARMFGQVRKLPHHLVATALVEDFLDKIGVADASAAHLKALAKRVVAILPIAATMNREIRVPRSSMMVSDHGVRRRNANTRAHSVSDKIAEEVENVGVRSTLGKLRKTVQEVLERVFGRTKLGRSNGANILCLGTYEGLERNTPIERTGNFGTREVPWGY